MTFIPPFYTAIARGESSMAANFLARQTWSLEIARDLVPFAEAYCCTRFRGGRDFLNLIVEGNSIFRKGPEPSNVISMQNRVDVRTVRDRLVDILRGESPDVLERSARLLTESRIHSAIHIFQASEELGLARQVIKATSKVNRPHRPLLSMERILLEKTIQLAKMGHAARWISITRNRNRQTAAMALYHEMKLSAMQLARFYEEQGNNKGVEKARFLHDVALLLQGDTRLDEIIYKSKSTPLYTSENYDSIDTREILDSLNSALYLYDQVADSLHRSGRTGLLTKRLRKITTILESLPPADPLSENVSDKINSLRSILAKLQKKVSNG